MTTIKSAKAALRKSMRQRLANVTSESLAAQCGSRHTDWVVHIEALGIWAASAVTRHITSHPAFQKSKCVACYLSMPTGEIQTDGIVDAVLGQGKTLYVPRLTTKPASPSGASSPPSSTMEFLKIHSKEDLQKNLVPGVWGIREPSVEYNGTPRETAKTSSSPPIDLILMPGMAFDKTLARLGHGKGYYDRFISGYRASIDEAQKKHEVLLCGLSLEEQILEDEMIPMTETDARLNMFITAQGAFSSMLDTLAQ